MSDNRRTRPCSVCGKPPSHCPSFLPTCGSVWEEPGVTPVVAAVLSRGGLVLLCRRPLDKRHGGLWEFPGGKLLPGETLAEAAQRELAEELSLTLLGVGAHLARKRDPGSTFEIHFVEVSAEGEPVSLEHEELAWVSVHDLLGYELAPGDRSFAEEWGRRGS